jgi:MFS transporter, DHA2 family, multidrug resistance protein
MATAEVGIHPTVDQPGRAVNPWIIGVVVSMAAFMEVLDTSIANVALPYMAGSLGASSDQITWVLTSYLVSNAIVLPSTGSLADMFGRKRFFMFCIAVFTASSFLCGIAPTLPMLLIFRILQGAGGGGLQPMAQAILADTFPPDKRGLAFALYGVTAVCAPAIGPTLGGWITDSYSWRWIFYINIPVGLLAIALVYQLVHDPPEAAKRDKTHRRFDYIGLSLLTLGVGALQVVLDKGQEDDWLGSHFIVTLSILSVCGLISLVLWEWFQKDPLVDVRLFASFNFSASTLMFFFLGFVLFAGTVLMPQYLQSDMGYTAEIAGLVLSGGSACLLIMLPVIGRLTEKIPAKYLIAFGWGTIALAMYISTRQTDLAMSFSSASLLRVYQSVPIGFLFVPISLAAFVGMPKEKSDAASGIVNFARNIGQSVGTSMVTTMLARREQFHQNRLVERASGSLYQNFIDSTTKSLQAAGYSHADAQFRAMARFNNIMASQGSVLSYVDIYMVLAVTGAVLFVLSFFLKRNQPGAGGDVPVG